MPKTQTMEVDAKGRKVEVYKPMARMFHWLTVGLIAVQIPIGLYMTYRGGDLNIWDATTNNLYSSHKLIGVIILLLVLARLSYRLTQGAPSHEPTLEPWQKIVSEVTHWAIYALLIVVPVLGLSSDQLFPRTQHLRPVLIPRGSLPPTSRHTRWSPNSTRSRP